MITFAEGSRPVRKRGSFESAIEFGFVEDDDCPCLGEVTFATPEGQVTI